MVRLRSQSGVGVLAMVLLLSAIASVIVMATHSLWRGSARTLFSVEERRQLINLARSGIAEAYFKLQKALDEGRATDRAAPNALDWCLATDPVDPLSITPGDCQDNVGRLVLDRDALTYEVENVSVSRQRSPDPEDGTAMGVIDFRITVQVKRASPAHSATLVMTERRPYRLADEVGPYGGAGRHIEVSPTPAGTFIDAR